jgi:hypothetical protein
MSPLAHVILVLSLSASALLAGPEHLIKQRAKDVRDQNNTAQGVQPKPVAPAPQPAQATAQPVLATPSQLSLNRFHADLAGIKQGALLEPAQKQKLAANLSGVAAGKKPSTNTVDRFVTSVHKAFSAKPLPTTARARLVQDIDAVLNPSKYPQAKPEAIFEDIRNIFASNGAPASQAADISATARVLAADVK